MCAFMIICTKKTAKQAISYFEGVILNIVPFRDAGEEPSTFGCSILDCLNGLEYGMGLGWYNFKTFNYKEYEMNH